MPACPNSVPPCAALLRCALGLIMLLAVLPAPAETRFDAATFAWRGARYASFFDEAASTACVELTIPAGQASSTEPLSLRRFALCSEDEWTTSLVYDPATSLTLTIGVADAPPGPNYLILRFPQSRRMTWTHFEIIAAQSGAPPADDVTTAALAARWRALVLRKLGAFYDDDTTGTWLANDPATDYHWMREDAYYAVALLDDSSTASHERANAILKTIARAQDRVSTSPTYGWFYVNAADRPTPDNTSTFFIPPILAHLCLSPPAALEPDTLAEIRTALWYVTDGVASRFVFPPLYENFYFMGTATLAMAARVFDNPAWAEGARTRLETAHAYFLARGGSAEWASPVYTAVSDWALGLIAEHTPDAPTRQLAEYLRQRLWLDVAAFYDPVHRQPTGPFSRVYEDGLRGGAGLTAFAMACLLGQDGFDTPDRLAEMVAAGHSLDINPCYWVATRTQPLAPPLRVAMRSARTTPTFVRQTNYYTDASMWLTPALSLGTVGATTAPLLGFEGLVAQIYETSSPVGLAPVFARIGTTHDDVFGYAPGDGYDMFGFQHEGRAIWLADSTFDSSTAAAPQAFAALVADERFATWQDWRIDGVAAVPPATFAPGAIVTARRAGAYLCAIPLYRSSLGPCARSGALVRSNGHAALVLFALDAAAPQPLAGRRLEAGWAIECSPASQWPSYDDFVASCQSAATLELTLDAATVSVKWTGAHELEAVFSRASRQWLERKVDGAPIEGPLLRSEFALQVTTSTLALRDFTAWDLPAGAWTVYPEGSAEALLASPAAAAVTVGTNWLPSPLVLGPRGLVVLPRPAASGVTTWRDYTSP